MASLRVWIRFAFLNFTAPIAFYGVFREMGAKPAIVVAIFFSILQLVAHRYYREKISPFFFVATGFVLIFGSMDLLIRDPRYFRLEGFATNFVMAIAFFGTAFSRHPLIQLFADSLPQSARPAPGEFTLSYARAWTLVWAVYLLVKALFFLYLAFQVNLGNLIVIRAITGGGSGALLLAAEYFYRKNLSRRRRLLNV